MARKKGKARILSLPKLIPNIITLLALSAGLTSIRYAIDGDWNLAVLAILAAAILDGIDGAVARLLKATSPFGAELDSFSDFLSFGVAPAIVLYFWVIQNAGGLGWIAALAFTIAVALRLARFNTAAKNAELEARKGEKPLPPLFFTGVPAPAGALLAIMPLVLGLQFELSMDTSPFLSLLVAAWALFVAGLMVSRVPTLSLKRLRVPHKLQIPVLACVGVVAALMIVKPWATLLGLGIFYLSSIPLTLYYQRRFDKK